MKPEIMHDCKKQTEKQMNEEFLVIKGWLDEKQKIMTKNLRQESNLLI